MIKIREILESDFDDAVSCIKRSVDISNRPDYPKKVIDYQLYEHYTLDWIKSTKKEKYFIIALLNDQIVGTGALKGNEIQNMFVDPDFQCKGIGKTLINHLESYARDLGFKSIKLNSSITAINFYRKLGYKIEEEEIVEWLGERIRSVKMNRTLD